MALFTTYLAQLKGENLSDFGLRNPKLYYVMRNRGNNEVAPSDTYLPHFLKLRKDYEKIGDKERLRELWEQYKENYFFQLGLSKDAQNWIRRVAEESLWRDIVLVCYERDYLHCHRHLLAQEIVRLHPEVCYVGELKLKT